MSCKDRWHYLVDTCALQAIKPAGQVSRVEHIVPCHVCLNMLKHDQSQPQYTKQTCCKTHVDVGSSTALDLFSMFLQHCRPVCILASLNVGDLRKHSGQQVKACWHSRPLTPDQQMCSDTLLSTGSSHSCCVSTLQATTCQLQPHTMIWCQPCVYNAASLMRRLQEPHQVCAASSLHFRQQPVKFT